MVTRVNGVATETTSYSFDLRDLLLTKTDPTGYTLTYAYDATGNRTNLLVAQASPLVEFLNQSCAHDNRNRVTNMTANGKSTTFTYDAASRLQFQTLPNGTTVTNGFDNAHQLLSRIHGRAGSPSQPLASFLYGYDSSGNRETATVNSRTGTYTANALNQYTQRTVPGYVWEIGSAASNATVTINNQATTRKGEYFSKEFAVANSSSAIYTQLVTVGVLKNAGSNQLDIVATTTGKVFTAKSPELFGYDADGNTTNDGRWAYVWDGENRLIQMQTLASVTSATSVVHQKLLFGYDSQSRRISKVVSNYVAGSWSLTSDLRFLYDGWNLIAEVGTTGSVVRSYVWGLDLSGSEQGAGGVGGLLAAHLGTNGTHFVAFDGNGNVGALVSASTGAESARYEYSPFGEVLRTTGSAAVANLFRFSTKYQDAETGLLYYGYRYYQPGAGRWLSRDPIGERGGLNRYGFVGNDPISRIDLHGLEYLQFVEEEGSELATIILEAGEA